MVSRRSGEERGTYEADMETDSTRWGMCVGCVEGWWEGGDSGRVGWDLSMEMDQQIKRERASKQTKNAHGADQRDQEDANLAGGPYGAIWCLNFEKASVQAGGRPVEGLFDRPISGRR